MQPISQILKRDSPAEAGAPRTNGHAKPNVDDFFANVNAAALARLDAWVPVLHPKARKQAGTGGWRVSSKDLGRDLEEDLSYHRDGIFDWGTREGLSPIDAVLVYGTEKDATEAARWLCRQIGVEPAALGFKNASSGKKSRGKKTPKTPQTPKPGAVEIHLAVGERARATDEALVLLRGQGTLYERGGELVRVVGGGVEPVSDDWLLDYFDRRVNFVATRETKQGAYEELRDAPQWLAKRISAKKGERGLRELRAVITAPTMREDGTLFDKPGYDEATGLLLVNSQWPRVPDDPTTEEMKAAAASLWKPFVEFPHVDDAARGVMLAGALTAVIRQTLPLAPGFSFDAPAPGTGKTLLAFCLQALSGMDRQAIPECRDEEEVRKRLLSALRSGQPGILLDNIRGQFGSAALEALLTTQVYSDRVLGSSHMLSLPTTVLVLISGNNFRPAGDLWRRLLTCRIDAKVEAPELRSFAIEPFDHCRNNRQELVAAALTLLRGFVAAGSPRATRDRLASYEQWDDRVRQAVIWIGEQSVMPEGAAVQDPVEVIERAKRAEPERMKLAALLAAVRALKGDSPWRVADLVAASKGEDDEAGFKVVTVKARALRDALEEIALERADINRRRLGRWVERQLERHCCGMWIERAGQRWGTALWQVRGTPEPDIPE